MSDSANLDASSSNGKGDFVSPLYRGDGNMTENGEIIEQECLLSSDSSLNPRGLRIIVCAVVLVAIITFAGILLLPYAHHR